MKIKITTGGIYGLPLSEDNTTGEYPIGHVLDIGDNEPPAGWAGRYIVVEENAPKGAKMVTASQDDGDADAEPKRGPGRPKAN